MNENKVLKNSAKQFFFFSLLSVSTFCYGQIGVKTESPQATVDVRAASHLNAVTATDGVLIPRVNNLTTNGSVDGQLVYLITEWLGKAKGFYYWNAPTSEWKVIAGEAADVTKDIWVDDPLRNVVKLESRTTGAARDINAGVEISDDGNVSIGNMAPKVKLDIRNSLGMGIISIGGTTVTAANAGAGALRYYESSGGQLHYSDGTSWYVLDSDVKKVSIVAKKKTVQNFPHAQVQPVTDWDVLADATESFAGSTGIFTAPRDGNYAISFSFNFSRATLNDGSQVEATLVTGVSAQTKKSVVTFPKGGQSQAGAAVSFVLKLNAGQTVRPTIYQSTGSVKALRVGNGGDDGFVNFSVAEL